MILSVVGARPNFIKMAPVILEAKKRGLPQVFVHTGQHYDDRMSAVFIRELGLPEPDINLGVGSASHAQQTAKIMAAFEPICLKYAPRLILVAGDVNSTLSAALTAVKLNLPVGHVESGLRSFDRTMPEEVNRVLTDHLSALLFTTEPSGKKNLRREGIDPGKIHFVGNTMIDSLRLHLPRALSREPWRNYQLGRKGYALATFHRPANVDSPESAGELAKALRLLGKEFPVLFPAHPRTLAASPAIWTGVNGIRVIEPLGYYDFLGLMAEARVVITDSGGIQEETTALRVPCVTVRQNTERPITLTEGTNRLVNLHAPEILAAALAPVPTQSRIPRLWDGRAAERVLDVIEAWFRS